MGITVRERAHESGLTTEQRRGEDSSTRSELLPEPQLPCGWEKCLDLKSGLIYFKDWNSGTLTYRDPRQSVAVATQRIGLLSISLSPESTTTAVKTSSIGIKKLKRKGEPQERHSVCTTAVRLPWGIATAQTATEGNSCPSEMEMRSNSVSMDEQSLELTLNLPGTTSARAASSCQEDSVCTMEKVRSALERSQWLSSRQPMRNNKRIAACSESSNYKLSEALSTALSLLSSRPSESRESSSPGRLQSRSCSKASSPTGSQCSSECFTSPSVMSYQGEDEEVQKPCAWRESDANGGEVMVTVGCKSCLMYVMLSKSHPSCPKCGNTDVLLHLPVPLPKKQRMTLASPSWSWCTA